MPTQEEHEASKQAGRAGTVYSGGDFAAHQQGLREAGHVKWSPPTGSFDANINSGFRGEAAGPSDSPASFPVGGSGPISYGSGKGVGSYLGTISGRLGSIAAVMGAAFGGYYYWSHGGDVVSAAGATGGLTFALFSMLGDYVDNLAPTSQVFFAVGWFVKWILGLYFAFYAACGGFFGAGIVWLVIDVVGGLHNASVPR